MLNFLPESVCSALKNLQYDEIYEIRLRANLPVFINYAGKYEYLSVYGITKHRERALVCDEKDVEDCIYRAGNYSVYSVEEELKQGFITAKNGVRIGLAGEYVMQNGQPLVVRNVTSVCVRIPHAVIGSAERVYSCCMSDRIRSTLIISPPGYGKTTILRDLTRMIAQNTQKNVLICDERAEIGLGDLGETCDVIQYCDKKTAFEAGIRAMRPDVIVTDELNPRDYTAVEQAVYAGVIVVATAHLRSINDVPKTFFAVFERVVVLSSKTVGKIEGIYDKQGREIAYA